MNPAVGARGVNWRSPAWRQAKSGDVPALPEWARGRAAIKRTINWFYDRVERDELLRPLFPGGAGAAHREHGSTWWREVF